MVDRYATRDVTLGGALVRRGDQVTVSITGANRDPALFGDPDPVPAIDELRGGGLHEVPHTRLV